MFQRGFRGVNSISTSQALSRVVEVAQGVFLRITVVFDFGFEERLLISADWSRRLDFALLTIYFLISALFCHIPICAYSYVVAFTAELECKPCFLPLRSSVDRAIPFV
jgi:hypothetical protein